MEVLLYFRSISRLSVHPNLEQLGLVHVARGTALLHVCRTGIQHQRSMKNSILTLRDFFSFTNKKIPPKDYIVFCIEVVVVGGSGSGSSSSGSGTWYW